MRSCKARFEGGICPPSDKRQRILEFSSLIALSTTGLLFSNLGLAECQVTHHSNNQRHSAKNKSPCGSSAHKTNISIGPLVHIKEDGNSSARLMHSDSY